MDIKTDPYKLLRSSILHSHRSLTFITTYKCTAACADCCFECSPQLESGKLTYELMKRAIDEALLTLPNLEVVVFSGGECYLLKDHLYRTIAYACSKGLSTRTVSNGYWGKFPATATRVAAAVAAAGLTEINFSTGLDHQQWVSLDAVANAAAAATAQDIPVLITIEKDTDESGCWEAAHAHPQIRAMLAQTPCKLTMLCNSWMPFSTDSTLRAPSPIKANEEGCTQLFSNVVITPHQVVSACCGLTFEHIPEMRIFKFGQLPLAAYVDEVASDFLKLWIHVDGPKKIVRKLLGEDSHQEVENAVHICQACAILHQDTRLRTALQLRYQEFVPDVMQRYLLGNMLNQIGQKTQRESQDFSVVE